MDIFQILASMASIISIPLAIYYARKNNNTTSEKARLDIIKTLSYRLSATHTLTNKDINSVFKSKLREHGITHAKFDQEDILNDLKSDIMSNAFLDNEVRNKILYNLSTIELIPTTIMINTIPKFLIPIIRLFISPIPYILFIANAIICIILLCPYIFDIIFYGATSNSFTIESKIYELISNMFHDIYLCISLICLFTLSVICFFRKKCLVQEFYVN